ncbi:MAG: YkgJ family cysteine cluster protein [Polyangiaceae bacterium]|nr:YkgJ family cysteine cluster protein [Polyangiaceae bacterium]
MERLALRTPFELVRTSCFAYACRRCSRCCSGKRIPLDPYEVARIAEQLGLRTTETLERYTTNGGALLAVREEGECVFLGATGCAIHPARPLACRLYPLGRRVTPADEERFAAVVPDPGCEGDTGGAGTVQDYLEQQQAEPFVVAADRYRAVLEKLVAALLERDDLAECAQEVNDLLARAPTAQDESLLDVDVVVGRRCAELGVPVPGDLEARIVLHLEALEAIASA